MSRACPTIDGRSPPICPPTIWSMAGGAGRRQPRASRQRSEARGRCARVRRRRCGRRSGRRSAPMSTRATGAAAPGCCRLPMPRRRIELLIATNGDAVYRVAIESCCRQWLNISTGSQGPRCARSPSWVPDYRTQLLPAVKALKARTDKQLANNPFGVPIGEGSWAGSNAGRDVRLQHVPAAPRLSGDRRARVHAERARLSAWPSPREQPLAGVDGRHQFQADRLTGTTAPTTSYVPGGMVPGVLIVKPDFPELKTDWPFLWFENEYTVSTTSAYILAANAAIAEINEKQ